MTGTGVAGAIGSERRVLSVLLDRDAPIDATMIPALIGLRNAWLTRRIPRMPMNPPHGRYQPFRVTHGTELDAEPL